MISFALVKKKLKKQKNEVVRFSPKREENDLMPPYGLRLLREPDTEWIEPSPAEAAPECLTRIRMKPTNILPTEPFISYWGKNNITMVPEAQNQQGLFLLGASIISDFFFFLINKTNWKGYVVDKDTKFTSTVKQKTSDNIMIPGDFFGLQTQI